MLVSILLCVSSCLKEDTANCPPTRRFVLRDETGDNDPRNPGAYANVADRATLYIYDRGGQFIAMQTWDNPQFGQEYTIDASLPDDVYNFVVWINHEQPCFEVPAFLDFPEVKPGKGQSTLFLQIPPDRTINYPLPLLMHGKLNNTTVAGDDHLITIPVTQITNTVVLTVNGLQRTRDTYSFNIADNNGAYDFDNNFASSNAFNYTTSAKFADGVPSLDATLTVLKLAANRNPVLTLTNRTAGETLYPSYTGQETNLVKLIQKAYGNAGIDFERRHVFHISITFDAKMAATVMVDGWKVNESDNELFP